MFLRDFRENTLNAFECSKNVTYFLSFFLNITCFAVRIQFNVSINEVSQS